MKTYMKTSKQQYAYQVIRSRILDGRYSPGHKLVIDQLARELKTSAIPVREAIRQLESDGLIRFKPFSGAFVTPFNEEAYMNTLSVLAVLEGHATALSSRHFPQSKIVELSILNDRMKDALQELNFPLFSNYNRDFHRLTYQYCGNEFLLDSIYQTWDRLDSVRATGAALKPLRMKKSIEEHEEIIGMLKNKTDEHKIEAFVRAHKMNTLQAFIEQRNES